METENVLTNRLFSTMPNEENELSSVEDGFSLSEIGEVRYGFRVGSVGLLCNEALYSEVVKSVFVFPIPNTPSWMLGLINLRGSLVPVFDLARYLQLELGNDGIEMLLVLDKGEHAVAVKIVEYPKLLNQLTELPTESASIPAGLKDSVVSVFEENGQFWYEIDKTVFFTAMCKTIGF